MPALDDPVALAYPVVGVGQIPAELDQARALYVRKQPKRVLEIGVWYGGTLREWLRLAAPKATVVAVDPDHLDPDSYEDWRKDDTTLVVLTGRSQDDVIKEQIAEQGPYDWIFLDGDHGENLLRADVELAGSVAAKGCCLLLHDIDDGGSDTTGPRRVLDDLYSQGFRITEIIASPEGTGYPPVSAHGIGVVQL